jgi:cob(I)alamin adenosyltransferase
MKIYTKTGDDGTTGLIDNRRVKKSNPRIGSYGMVDELNAALGMILSSKLGQDIRNLLTKIQNDLFVVGADLANPNLEKKSNRVTTEMILFLEKEIDRLEEKLPSITYFILPGGDLIASQVHLARAICRRAETNIVRLSEVEDINNECLIYMNRLSDLLFVIARTINKRKKISDVAWKNRRDTF